VVALRKWIWLIISTVIVAATILIGFWVNSILPPPPDFPAPDVAPVSPHYLPFVPVSWRDINETRIFLEAASPRYGYYKNQTSGRIQKGDPCFIINVKVRNDYTEDNPPPTDQEEYNFSRYGYYIYFDVRLYNKNGTVDVEGVAVRTQPGWCGTYAINWIRVDNGETKNFDVYVATDKRDIERFELLIFDIGPEIVQ
jgi:hypothetical protein